MCRRLSRYPSAVLVDPGSRLHIRLSENRRPERFSLTSSQSPDGESRRIDTTLRRVERDGKTVAWDAYFRVDRPNRHYYLGAFGVWKDNGGKTYGDAYWRSTSRRPPEANVLQRARVKETCGRSRGLSRSRWTAPGT